MSEPEILRAPSGENAGLARPGGNADRPWGVERRGAARLFLDYYGLNEQPFGVTPDLRFLYLGSKHRQALDVLNYGTELNRGFLTLIAKPGMGKTSLLFHYLEGLREKARTVFLFQTDGDSTEFMRYLLADLGLDGKGMDLPEMRAMLSQVLMGEMKNRRPFILVIDEAQNLDEKVLESVRLLSNFETPWMKLMQIVLAGQPQLAEKLAKPSMAQLRQRVSFSVRIEPFTREEVDLYLDHRLWVAGYKGSSLFTVGARTLIAERSEGIPRNINNMCFCAMSFAWAMKEKTIGREMMHEVLADLEPGSRFEKEVPAPKLPDEPKLNISQAIHPVGLTMEPPPNRGPLAKSVIASILQVVLGWGGVQLDIGKWIGPSFRSLSDTVRNFVDPTTAPAGPANSSTTPNSGGLSVDHETSRPPQNGVVSSTSSMGQN